MTQASVEAGHLTEETTEIFTPEADTSPIDHDSIFRPLFDSYVSIADGQGGLPSVAGTDPETKNPIFEYVDRQTVAEARLSELRSYIKNAIANNDMGVNPLLLRADAPVTVTVLTERYIEIGLAEARARMLARGQIATHITVSEVDSQPETSHSFIEIVKGIPEFALSALKNLSTRAHYHSGEIPLQQTDAIPVEEQRVIVKK